ncbi:MAG: hypothetical protein EXQ92_13780 [Alphaproteobacteria bacterium]|nr:hypothetical protein [Alphaproteobacteria bacterium]
MSVETAPPVPECEDERIQALERYNILDTPLEVAFDRITHLAATAFGMPIALISLVDRGRQWFKPRHGMKDQQTARDVAFSAHAICGD